MKNSARTIALSVAKLLISINSKLVNFLNCGNVLTVRGPEKYIKIPTYLYSA